MACAGSYRPRQVLVLAGVDTHSKFGQAIIIQRPLSCIVRIHRAIMEAYRRYHYTMAFGR